MMFNAKENEPLFRPTSIKEIQLVLKSFSKDKCPSLDGWTVDFFYISSTLWDRSY